MAVMEEQGNSQVLVAKAQNGDREAFDQLVERYRGRIAAFLKARLGEHLRKRVDVDDLLQDVLLRAFSSLGRFRWSEDEAFFRWLATISRNVIHEVARREKRELLLPSEENLAAPGASPHHALERRDRYDRLKAAIDDLKPEYRRVILLARIQRMPIRDVAARMNRTPDAIAQLLRRALEKLKTAFGNTESFSLPDRSLLDEEGRPHD